MSRGGARPGAGRKPGSSSVKLREVALKLSEEGVMPLTVMVETMRDLWAKDKRLEACAIAEKAAPYMHPRLTAIDHSGEIRTPTVMELPPVAKGNAEWIERNKPKTPTIQ